MKVGEKAILKIRSDYGYGDSGSPPKIPGKAELLFDVELLGYKEKQKERWQMDAAERLKHAETLKADGTDLFKNQKFAEAIGMYEEAALFAVDEGISGDDVPDEERALYVSCWSNAAMCYVKLKSWADAKQACNKVLDITSESKTNIKALYRRGLSHLKLGLYKEAKTDLMAAYNIDNTNKDVRKALQMLKDEVAASKKKEKATFGGFFNKVDMYKEKKGIIAPNANGDNPHVFFNIKQADDDLGR